MKTIRSGFTPFTPMDRRDHPSGFTLLELMIGLVIVAILATLAIPNFSKAIEKTKVKEAQAVLSALYSAEKVYRLDQGSYGTLAQLVSGRYISDPDPSNNNADWNFAAVATGGGPPFNSFSAVATRTGGGYDGQTIAVDQTFSGTNYAPSPNPHSLRD